MDSKDTFAVQYHISPNSKLCIFLPSYNTIEQFYIGIEKGSTLSKVDYPKANQTPIIFFGNSLPGFINSS